VSAEPVVGEDRVGLLRVGRVLEHVNLHAMPPVCDKRTKYVIRVIQL
jgi:hypothetical protein